MRPMAVFEIALPLFLIMDPVGNASICLALLRDYEPRRQRRVILRELLFALAIVFLFYFIGEGLLGALEIEQSTLRVAGGVILFIISLKMVFPRDGEEVEPPVRDPFIVPIAVPLIAGPSLLATVMVFARRAPGGGALVLLAILAAWAGTAVIMLVAPALTRVLGARGMRAAVRLMGLVLILMAVQMLEDGVRLFLLSLPG